MNQINNRRKNAQLYRGEDAQNKPVWVLYYRGKLLHIEYIAVNADTNTYGINAYDEAKQLATNWALNNGFTGAHRIWYYWGIGGIH